MASRGLRNNNPGNLKRQSGSTPYKGEIVPSLDPPFRQFQSMAYGYRAMFHLLVVRYIKDYGLNTIEKIIYRYAPPIENDTVAYINYVGSYMAISPDTEIKYNDENTILELGRAISAYENGVPANETHLRNGWNMLKVDIELDVDALWDEGRNPDDKRNALIFLAVGVTTIGILMLMKNN